MTEKQYKLVLDVMSDARDTLMELSGLLEDIDFCDAQRVDEMMQETDNLLAFYERLEGSEYIEKEE